jgi:transcriptional regulator with GAF, ATPase, and Fis domain
MNSASDFSSSETSNHTDKNACYLPGPSSVFNSAITLNNLFGIILKKILPLFAVDCAVILDYDDYVTVIREAYVSKYSSEHETVTTELVSQPSELSSLQKTIAGFTFPVIKSREEWIEEGNVNHKLLNEDSHYQYHCYIPLEFNNKILGTFELHNSERNFSAECLTFCSNISDFLAEIIYVNRNTKLFSASVTNALIRVNKENNSGSSFINSDSETHQLDSLNKQIGQIKDLESLNDFVREAIKLFPSGYKQLKSQLEEILTYKALFEDGKPYISEISPTVNNYPFIIGNSPAMNRVFRLLDQVCDSDSTVLILGETGTGKELIAQAVHEGSKRRDKKMIKVNCAAIPPNLIESELFGHEKGSFTGATDQRTGKFELADNSTIFLDEIGELPLDLQVKLLRVLQEQEIERVGGKSTIRVNVRIISATNRDLYKEVQEGRFRQDLYYRLNIFPIALPPLRERPEDIPILASYFLSKYAKGVTKFSKRAIKQMLNYTWPGNVREMEHLIERQSLLNKNAIINELSISKVAKTTVDDKGAPQKVKTIDENERDHIFAVLKLCNGRISGENGAAKLLGVPATTLNSKIKRLGLNKKHF